jgi:hypothetical protein
MKEREREREREKKENQGDIHKNVRKVLIPDISKVTESFTQGKSNIDAKKGEINKTQKIATNLKPKESGL